MVKPRENRVPIMMSEEELKSIDDWRFARRVATRSDAVRRLVRNGLWIENEVAEIAERAHDAHELVYERYHEIGDYLSQLDDPDAPPVELNPREVLDRMRYWMEAVEEEIHILSIQTLSLNNRLISVAQAPHMKGALEAGKKELEKADERREAFLRQREEWDENRRLALVMDAMTEDDKKQYETLSDEQQEKYLTDRMKELVIPDQLESGALPESVYAKRRRARVKT